MSLWPVTLTVAEMTMTQDSAVFDPMIGIFSFSHLSFGMMMMMMKMMMMMRMMMMIMTNCESLTQ